MKKARIVSMLLAASLCAGVLAGCGGNAGTPSSSGAASKPTASSGSDDIVKLTWVKSGAAQKDEQAVMDAINDYTREKLGVEIANVYIETDYASKLSLEFATGTSADIAWLPSWFGQESLINQNAVLDITDMLDSYPELRDCMPEKVWKASEFSGRRYLVPNLKEIFYGYSITTPKEFADQVKELNGFDFAAVEFDKTASEADNYRKLEKYMEGLKEIGVEYPVGNLMVYGPMGLAPTHYEQLPSTELFGIDTQTNQVFCYFDTDEYEDYCRLMYDWNQKGYISEEASVAEWNTTADGYAVDGLVGLYHWSTTPDNEKNCSTRLNREMIVKEITDNFVAPSSVLGSCWAISAKTEKADACLRFLQLLSTDQTLADLYCYGVEGRNYTRISDEVVEPIADSGWSNDVWCSVNVLTPSIKNSESADKKDQYRTMNDAAVEGKTLGFSPDTSAISTELAALQNVKDQYRGLLEMGFYDVDTYLPEFRQALKDAGVETVIAELQKQYDAWLETK